MAQLTIGQVAKQTGVTVEAIRFYEKQGLVAEPQRSASGYRQYPEPTVERIRFIQRAKTVGFTLKEIQELLHMRASPDVSCTDVRGRAMEKIQDIEKKLNDLQKMKQALLTMVAQCSEDASASECPILDALEETTR